MGWQNEWPRESAQSRTKRRKSPQLGLPLYSVISRRTTQARNSFVSLARFLAEFTLSELRRSFSRHGGIRMTANELEMAVLSFCRPTPSLLE
jgi:hypothetical protein